MTADEFEKLYPREKYKYVHTRSRQKGHLGQTEIDYYDIVDIATGETVHQATYTDHTDVRTGHTSKSWN